MAGEDQIGAALPLARIRIEIGAQQPRRLAGHQHAAVIGLAHALVAGRRIHDHCRARHGQPHARRIGHPQILTDLRADGQRGHLAAAKQHFPAERHPAPQQLHLAHGRRSGREVAHFIIDAVIRQIALGHHAQHAPALDERRAIVQPALQRQRQPHADGHVQRDRSVAYARKRLERTVQQRPRQKQIRRRIARYAQLRQRQQLRLPRVCLTHQRNYALRVSRAVRHPYFRRSYRHAHKSIPHRLPSLIHFTPFIIPNSRSCARCSPPIPTKKFVNFQNLLLTNAPHMAIIHTNNSNQTFD